MDSDQKCKFTDFVRSTATAIMWLQNSILLQVIRCIQLVQRQNMETSTCLCVVLSNVICLQGPKCQILFFNFDSIHYGMKFKGHKDWAQFCVLPENALSKLSKISCKKLTTCFGLFFHCRI